MPKIFLVSLFALLLVGCGTPYQIRITEYSTSTFFRGAGIVVSEKGQQQSNTSISIEYTGENSLILVDTKDD